MAVNNWPKLIIILFLLACLTLLLSLGKVGYSDVDKYYFMIAGYVIGNGLAARRNESVEPVIAKKGTTNGER